MEVDKQGRGSASYRRNCILVCGPVERKRKKKQKREEKIMLEFKYATQLLIEGQDLDEDEINYYITEHIKGA